MHKRTLPLLLSLIFPATLLAEELPTAKAPPALAEKITELVDGAIKEKQLVGAVVAVSRNGTVLHLSAHGQMNREDQIPMREDAIFRIYSMTKAITTAAAMILVEEGAFALDDPIGNHIPELADLKVYARPDYVTPARQPTVRDLMRHTAGFAYGFFGDGPVDQLYRKRKVIDNGGTLQGMIRKLSKLPLAYAPGDDWAYSASVDVLGHLIEIKSGIPLDTFLQERIFTPLDMVDTGFEVPAEKLDRFAASYNNDPTAGLLLDDPATSQSRYAKPATFLSGGGGLVSTTRDYLHFLQMIANDGKLFGNRLLKKSSVAEMTRNQLPDSIKSIAIGGNRPGVGFGLGFSVRTQANDEWDPAAPVGEYGWGGAASTHYWVSPDDKNLIVVTMEQTKPFSFLLESLLKGPIYEALRRGEPR